MSNSKMREALRLLLEVQDEECRFDHNGYCQAHNLDHALNGCRVAIAREALTQPDDAVDDLVRVIQTAIRVLDSDSGPMTRESVSNDLRAMLAASQPEVQP